MWQIIVLCAVVVTNEAKYENINMKYDWWETAAIYRVYTRSFLDSDGDGIGDILGVSSRLEYFRDIGIDVVWLSPIFKSPLHDYGYDISDYYTIHHEYGTTEDFEHLLKKANELNIKVILDIVLNHSSNESDWFIKSMHRDEYYSDWYIWEHGHVDSKGIKKPPTNWVSVFKKSAWTYSPIRDQFYLHQFGHTQPDLNFRNPVVVDELKNVLKFWLEKGVAGMMISSVNHFFEVDKDMYGGRFPNEPVTGSPGVSSDNYDYLEHVYTKDLEDNYELVSQFRDVFDAITLRDNMTRTNHDMKERHGFMSHMRIRNFDSATLHYIVLSEILLTETSYTTIKNTVRYYGEGIQNGAQIPLNAYLMSDLDKDYDARDLKFTIDKWLTYKPLKKHANWMIGNHDHSRLASRFRGELVDAFNMLVLLLPGIGITYMGEEIGMINGFVTWGETRDPLACNTDDPVNFIDVTRDPYRTPFQWSNGKNAGFSTSDNPWLPVADGFETTNVDFEKAAVRSHYQVFRTLASLRKRPAFRMGRYESLALTKDVFAFKRWYNDDTYIVIMNVGRTYRVVNLTAFDLVFGSLEVEASSILSSRTYSDNLSASYLDLAADEALVLRMQV